MNYKAVSMNRLRILLLHYQKRLSLGERIPRFTELATISGVHRDTLYSLIAGNRICERSQYAISKALKMVNESSANQPSRLMSIELGCEGPKLRFGLNKLNIFKGT
jgi:hypothetical protein